MSLPTLSTLNTTQDTNKQLSQIRSYLVQLKDELESELSNVTYEMLSASLQKKIDQINDDIAQAKEASSINAQLITAEYAKVGDLVADAITTANLYADTVSASAITTANAYADSVVANKVTAQDVSSIVAEFGYITATEVSTNYITSKAVYADFMEVNNWVTKVGQASYIKTGKLSAESITTALSDPSQGTIKVGTVQAQKLQMGCYNSSGALTGYKTLSSHYLSLKTASGTASYWYVTREA